MLLVVPSDSFHPRQPDEHFAAEYHAAVDLGVEVAVVDHDALTRDRVSEAIRRIPEHLDVVYRGWMLTSAQYAAFDQELRARSTTLRTDATSYRTAHELPGWIAAVGDLTAATVWTTSDSIDEFDVACARIGAGPAVLRDHVKSAKHHWDEAVYVRDTADLPAATSIAARLRAIRGDDFTGGFVIRRFEEYVSAEVRTWWIDGRCRLATAHPDTPDTLPVDVVVPANLETAINGLGLRFATADLVLRADGTWRLIEIGDGQVSDRPRSTDPAALVDALSSTRRQNH